jgi:16S rRNA (guanine527-N7)-methyltransferase
VTGDERTQLVESCAQLGIDLPSATSERLFAYLDLLYFWNRSAGLTSVVRSRALRLHLLDSLAFVEDLHDVRTIADIGTGGGLPGIPVAIVLETAQVVLVESRRRKCSFLHEVLRELRLENCEVLEYDAGTLEAAGHRFDAVVSRAFLPVSEWVGFAAPLLRPGGRVLVAAGPECDVTEIVVAGRTSNLDLKSERSIVLPGGEERRRILRLELATPQNWIS